MLQFPRAKKKEMIQERCQEEKREKYDNLAKKSARIGRSRLNRPSKSDLVEPELTSSCVSFRSLCLPRLALHGLFPPRLLSRPH